VDIFYRYQAVMFGTGIDVATLVKKTSMDMFVVSPIIFVPTGMLLLHLKNSHFRVGSLREALTWKFYRAYVVPTMPYNWAYWIPVVLCVYALPTVLQFPFAQLAEAAWSLLFVFIASEVGEA
jgi:hypothetical protein